MSPIAILNILIVPAAFVSLLLLAMGGVRTTVQRPAWSRWTIVIFFLVLVLVMASWIFRDYLFPLPTPIE